MNEQILYANVQLFIQILLIFLSRDSISIQMFRLYLNHGSILPKKAHLRLPFLSVGLAISSDKNTFR